MGRLYSGEKAIVRRAATTTTTGRAGRAGRAAAARLFLASRPRRRAHELETAVHAVLRLSDRDAAGDRALDEPAAAADAGAAVPALGLPAEQLPRHVGVIMDGNARWAARRGLPAAAGHRAGVAALRAAVRCARAWRVPALTAFAFSEENWARPAAETGALLALMEAALRDEVGELQRQGVRLRCVLGTDSRLPASLRAAAAAAELATADNCDLHFSVLLSYGGRQDVAAAARALAEDVAAGRLAPDGVTADALAARLASARLPAAWRDPDLVIRTSGERRLSNFMPWEAAWAELHFCDTLWPDFGADTFAAALHDYAARQRRFGRRGAAPA